LRNSRFSPEFEIALRIQHRATHSNDCAGLILIALR
jgi:hypothetical protein